MFISVRNTLLALIVSLNVSAASAATAKSPTAERREIAETLGQHRERLSYLEDRISRTQDELAEVHKALTEKELELAVALRDAEQQPSDITARAATQASIRFNRVQARSDRLEERLLAAREEIDSIDAHKRELLARLDQLTAEEQRRAAAQQAQTARQAAAIAATETPAAATPLAASAEPEQAAPQEPAGWPSPADESQVNVDYARTRLAALDPARAGTPPLPKVRLNHNRGRGSEDLTYLGGQLYSVSLPLEAGMWGFKLFNQTYWVSIPQQQDGQRYRLVYDLNGRPALHVIREALLQ